MWNLRGTDTVGLHVLSSMTSGRKAILAALIAAGVLLFDLAYSQHPLYADNYTAYALRGLASAGRGALAHDWYARTADPFPLVSLIFDVSYRAGAPWLAYGFHSVLLGVFLVSLTLIARRVFSLSSLAHLVTFAAGIVVLHSVLLRKLVETLTGGDWGWYLQSGVAMQYLLGFIFQPSLFGVLNVASLAAFLHRRDAAAAILASLACCAHASYALTSAILIGCYLTWRLLERDSPQPSRTRRLLPLLLPALLVFVPGMILTGWRFAPTDVQLQDQARHLLADLRIPNHAQPDTWLHHRSIIIQLAVVALGLLATRGERRLQLVLWALFGVAALGTAAQMISHSPGLALLFPWRTSVLLVPLSLSLALGWLVSQLRRPVVVRISAVCLGGVVLAAALVGARATRAELREDRNDPAFPVMRFVGRRPDPRMLYLIPTAKARYPTFMSRFRIESGARTYVDWKSHPYRDVEVVEWFRRLQRAREIEAATGARLCDGLARLRREEDITHLIRPTRAPVDCASWKPIYDDGTYAIYRAVSAPL